MKVYLPTDNRLTRGYKTGHRGYDFAGLNLPDNVRAGKDGEIIERVNRYVNNWINTGTLTTRDYGNYIKVKHTDGTYELHAHLRKDSSFVTGTKVQAGQTIARIGNTGNSTGPHLHSEYRNADNKNIQVEFYTSSQDENMNDTIIKKASQWDEVVQKLNLGEPEHTLAEAVINLVGGLKSTITTAQRERDEHRVRANNAEEQLSRVREQVLIMEGEVQGLTVQSKKLREMNDQQGRVIGSLEEDVQRLETENRELKKQVVSGLSRGELLRLTILKFLRLG